MMDVPQFLIMVPGSIMDADGHTIGCKNEAEMHTKEKEWRDLGFSKVVVYEKIS